ncbi:MAG: flagellar basal-body rod protein FlgG [candidate division Zixibacteria bacterium]|nr:flagellar basal-body rod protein FlgG [candidate division Zixibacteria bacterium]
MIKAMRTAASGMSAQQMNVDNIANNLANVNTTGFKKSKVEFQDVLYQRINQAGVSSATGSVIPTNLEVGYGVKPVATTRQFAMGELQSTENPLDMAIQGNGFFQVAMPDGTNAYTRDGTFKVSPDGRLITSDGFFVYPEITIPEDAESVQVTPEGVVSVMQVGQAEPTEIGQFELARFVNPAGLSAMGHNLFQFTAASGDPITAVPGEEGIGAIAQGYLEVSNVDVVNEMVNMIIAQRAYEINSKAIQTSEDMTQIATNLKR